MGLEYSHNIRKVLVGGTFQYSLSKEGDVMNEQCLDSEVNEYIEIRSDKSDLESKWEMAIGLQQVDNLTPSEYMKDLVKLNIKNEISLDELENRLKKYYNDLNDGYYRDEYECDFVSLRIMQMLQNNMFFLTIDFYKYVHYFLFKDVYKFAGKFREVNISKDEEILNGDTVVYCDYNRIKDYLIHDFSEERKEDYNKLCASDKIISISNFTSCIWQVHSFMEGNTRTTAIFMIKYLKELGYNINSLFKDNSKYFIKITDQNYKPAKTLIHYLVKAAGKDANLLMNIGPQPDGELPAVAMERLAEIGEWMKVYGETIYGTRGGCVAPHPWGVTTQKGNKLYVHILDLQDKALFLPLDGKRVKKAVGYTDRRPLKIQKCRDGVMLYLSEVPTDIDKVIELHLEE